MEKETAGIQIEAPRTHLQGIFKCKVSCILFDALADPA
jgi:hypothetical protein